MISDISMHLQRAVQKADTISKSKEYGDFLGIVRDRYPWRFNNPSYAVERDYCRVVDHHLKHLLPTLEHCVRPDTRKVLDFGCGSGGSAIALAMVFSDLACFGTDVDAQEITMAIERAKLYGVQDRCQFLPVGENEPLPFPDASFDFCLCSSVLEYVTDKDARRFCVREMARLLAPGGLLFFSGPNRLYPFEIHSWWNGKPKWGWNYFPKALRAETVDYTVWEVQKLVRPDRLVLYKTPLAQLFTPWSSFCLRKEV